MLFRILIKVLLSIAFLLCTLVSISQEELLADSIDQVMITAAMIFPDDIDREVKSNELSLEESLQNVSPVQLQSNGPGYLTTALMHGFGARHTAIVWNVVNIQSPVNGTFDLSLINGFDNTKVSTKSLSANLGTASLGGALILDNGNKDYSSSITLSLSDIENVRTSLYHEVSLSKFSTQVQYHLVKNQNKFDYKFNNIDNQWDAKFEGHDIHLNTNYRHNDRLSIFANAWLQRYDRDVPGSLVTSSQAANQSDNNYRYQLGTKYLNKYVSAKLSYTHFREQLIFETLSIDSRALNHVNAINLSVARKGHIINLSQRYDNTDANFFGDAIQRSLSQLTYRYNRVWNEQINSSVVVSKQLQDDRWSPLLFDISIRRLVDPLSVKLSVNRSYNLPTLNDQFWPQGGNPSLLPEDAIGIDLDVEYRLGSLGLLRLSPYYKQVENWILWTPGELFWSPKNQRQVKSRGFDLLGALKIFENLSSEINFSFTRATIEGDTQFPNLIGNQLIFIPEIKSSIVLNYKLAGLSVQPELLYVGKRYLTSDNTTSLPSYLVTDLSISRDIKLKNDKQLGISISAHNLLNKDYQQIRFYPMPLRYFELKLNFKKLINDY